MHSERTRVALSGLTLDNPVIAASGTFGYGREFPTFTTSTPGLVFVQGHDARRALWPTPPRVAECASGMLNAWACRTRYRRRHPR
jgi:dihydroorotate dehydrogenase (NAD+) catalytic subunit